MNHIEAARQVFQANKPNKTSIQKFVMKMKKEIQSYIQCEEDLFRYFCVLESEKSDLFDYPTKKEFEQHQIQLTKDEQDLLAKLTTASIKDGKIQDVDVVNITKLYSKILKIHLEFTDLLSKKDIK